MRGFELTPVRPRDDTGPDEVSLPSGDEVRIGFNSVRKVGGKRGSRSISRACDSGEAQEHASDQLRVQANCGRPAKDGSHSHAVMRGGSVTMGPGAMACVIPVKTGPKPIGTKANASRLTAWAQCFDFAYLSLADGSLRILREEGAGLSRRILDFRKIVGNPS